MNIDKIMGKIVPPRGASLAMQQKWRGFSPTTKNKLRSKLRDSDRDGVPNMFDCQPFNKLRQDEKTQKYLDRAEKNYEIRERKKEQKAYKIHHKQEMKDFENENPY